ncbi:MAG: DUF3846 domain-containing protein [Bacteroidales bacterium]|nr:DUF3846 domain-containing protein [Bacteroidales bacterium]
MNEEEIRVLVVEPEKPPYERTIRTLEDMRKIVGGPIEPAAYLPHPVMIVCNEEGMRLNLPQNRIIMDESGQKPIDVILGTFFLAGSGTEDFISLTDEQIQKYTEFFSQEETMVKSHNLEQKKQSDRVPVNVLGVCAFPAKDPAKWQIRFVDTGSNTLFTIPDGESIVLTRFDGDEQTFPCHYIDSHHFEAFGSAYHIMQFAQNMERNGNIYRPEHPAEGLALNTYEVFQLKDSCRRDYGFMSYEYAKDKIRPEHYKRVYGGFLDPKGPVSADLVLEGLFARHNFDTRPFRKGMLSMSMSDIVVLNRGGRERQAFYVDRVGFAECREFLNPPNLNPPQKAAKRRKNPER